MLGILMPTGRENILSLLMNVCFANKGRGEMLCDFKFSKTENEVKETWIGTKFHFIRFV